jgi:pseudouridylate synthase
MQDVLSVAPEVAAALAARQPVVALESTAIAHGLPHPDNLAAAAAIEQAVRDGGAVPATIAVMDGRIRIGLDADDIARLAEGGDKVLKVSRRDLPLALARGAVGATTVAATMIAARLSGIAVFATGGIGGVHRGAESSFDISADLDELARTDVCVVTAGAKSILDLPKTLEALETRGVTVLGWKTDDFPAFYARSSGLPVDGRCDGAEEVARIMHIKWRMGLSGGVVLGAPIPADSEPDAQAMEAGIQAAIVEAATLGIVGKALTPFLLKRLHASTGGDSLHANTALLIHNARVGAEIAVAYADLAAPPALPPRPLLNRMRY